MPKQLMKFGHFKHLKNFSSWLKTHQTYGVREKKKKLALTCFYFLIDYEHSIIKVLFDPYYALGTVPDNFTYVTFITPPNDPSR